MDLSATGSDGTGPVYKWNLGENGLPLLGLAQERLRPGFDQLLMYRADQFEFPIFRSLVFDGEHNRYLMPASSSSSSSEISIEFTRTGAANTYTTAAGVALIDKGGLKTIQTADGTKFLFVQYPDGEFRCATIRQKTGGTLNLLYTANGLVLHGAVDSTGRSLTFNYGQEGIRSLTQTWMSNLEGFTKTWSVGDDADAESSIRFAHAGGRKKFLPANALVHEYTAEMIASDKLLAQIFGGPTAVAGANGFEPAGLAVSYPFYRGDVIGDDGRLRNGHLSHAIHLYGAPDGRGDSPLYIPAGFTSHSSEPSPTDAAMIFYYPRLGNLTDVTLAVFHVANFQMVPEGNRVRIGNIGGPGGSSPLYKHSHIEFYRGNTGLPSAAARAALRIDPVTVF
jgi:putative intracellular protease/amidase